MGIKTYWFHACMPRTAAKGTISTRMIYIFELLPIYICINPKNTTNFTTQLHSTPLPREGSSELPNFMGFAVIMIDDIVF